MTSKTAEQRAALESVDDQYPPHGKNAAHPARRYVREGYVVGFLAGIAWRDANPKKERPSSHRGDEYEDWEPDERPIHKILNLQLEPETQKVLDEMGEERRKGRLRDAEELPLKAMKKI